MTGITMKKLPGGYVVESGASQIARLGTAPVPGYNYPCRECGYWRQQEVNARHIQNNPAGVRRARARHTDHIRADHPQTLPEDQQPGAE